MTSGCRRSVVQPCPEDEIGFTSVAVDGDVVALGVDRSVVNGAEGGRLYVYRRSTGGTWVLEAILTHFDNQSLWRRFVHVAVKGDWLIGASYFEAHAYRYKPALADPPEPPSCALLHPGKWQFKGTMLPSDVDNPVFSAIDMSAAGTRLVIGDTTRDKVYVFDRAAGVWSQAATLEPFRVNENIGAAVAIGGPDADGASIVATGPRVFAETATGWRQIRRPAGHQRIARLGPRPAPSRRRPRRHRGHRRRRHPRLRDRAGLLPGVSDMPCIRPEPRFLQR